MAFVPGHGGGEWWGVGEERWMPFDNCVDPECLCRVVVVAFFVLLLGSYVYEFYYTGRFS